MQFHSTRSSTAVSIDTALAAGLAPDGGLYVPERIPAVTLDSPGSTLAHTAQLLLAPYFASSRLRDALPDICNVAFNFPAPLRALAAPNDHLLELFHGPTAAFKDYAARFLAECLARLRDPGTPPTTILVATSGDTG
ncbi:MAG TPA: threonine synthase, partial [Lysobacter sp.]|nr:threonine synthase [Lysobacter sp.]